MPQNQYTVARRSIWYLLRTMLSIALIVVLCLLAFVTAMHISSCYILVTEGLELRAEQILKGGQQDALPEYFTPDFIAKDPALLVSPYGDFKVSNFIYKIEIKHLMVLPGQRKTTVKVYEKLLSLSASPNEGVPENTPVPPWTPAIYNVRLVKTKGRWFISDMMLVEENPPRQALPTPDLSQLATPEP